MNPISLPIGFFEPSVVIYFFPTTAKPVTQSPNSNPYEAALLSNLQRNDSGLVLYKTTGIFKGNFEFTQTTHPVFRLHSPINHAQATFCFFKFSDSGVVRVGVNVIMLQVEVEHQGNFYNVKDFFLNRFSKTLFGISDVNLIAGMAMPNENPVRRKDSGLDWREQKTRDGKTIKLVRFYEFLGLSSDGKGSNRMVLTRQAFNALPLRPQRPVARF